MYTHSQQQIHPDTRTLKCAEQTPAAGLTLKINTPLKNASAIHGWRWCVIRAAFQRIHLGLRENRYGVNMWCTHTHTHTHTSICAPSFSLMHARSLYYTQFLEQIIIFFHFLSLSRLFFLVVEYFAVCTLSVTESHDCNCSNLLSIWACRFATNLLI